MGRAMNMARPDAYDKLAAMSQTQAVGVAAMSRLQAAKASEHHACLSEQCGWRAVDVGEHRVGE